MVKEKYAIFGIVRGYKQYELSNHLGNVLTTLSDKKGYNLQSDYYLAEILSAQDYYPSGMLQPGRVYSNSDYRYGFNGMEKDDEVKGSGNSYTTEFRQYDPRLGKWLSIDPLFANFPWQSPYVAFDNNPIYFKDPRGLAAEGNDPKSKRGESGKEVVANYIETGTSYSQEKREFGLDAKYSDCSSLVTTILQYSGQGDLFKFKYTGSGLGGGIQREIQEKEGTDNLKDPYRKTDPIVSDIMMWKGHIAIVVEVTDSKVKWANMGEKSKAGIRSASLKSEETIKKGAEAFGSDFWGFWTPPNPDSNDEAKPSLSNTTSIEVQNQVNSSEPATGVKQKATNNKVPDTSDGSQYWHFGKLFNW